MRRFCLVNVAIALLLMSKNTKMQQSTRTCACVIEVLFVEYGLYMFCVACMTCAHGVAVKVAIALLLIVESKTMQESIRLSGC